MKLLGAAAAASMLAWTWGASADASGMISKAPEGAEVYFITPNDGDTVSSRY